MQYDGSFFSRIVRKTLEKIKIHSGYFIMVEPQTKRARIISFQVGYIFRKFFFTTHLNLNKVTKDYNKRADH